MSEFVSEIEKHLGHFLSIGEDDRRKLAKFLTDHDDEIVIRTYREVKAKLMDKYYNDLLDHLSLDVLDELIADHVFKTEQRKLPNDNTKLASAVDTTALDDYI